MLVNYISTTSSFGYSHAIAKLWLHSLHWHLLGWPLERRLVAAWVTSSSLTAGAYPCSSRMQTHSGNMLKQLESTNPPVCGVCQYRQANYDACVAEGSKGLRQIECHWCSQCSQAQWLNADREHELLGQLDDASLFGRLSPNFR